VAEALADQNGIPGAIMDPVLIDRLGLALGDTFRLGTQDFRLTAALTREPDSASTGFTLGPRTVVRADALATRASLAKARCTKPATACFCPPMPTCRSWRTKPKKIPRQGPALDRQPQRRPGIEEFVDRIGSFLVLVGLAGLAVGGVGISAAIRSYLDGKVATIATLKTLGATGGLIFRIYLWQTGDPRRHRHRHRPCAWGRPPCLPRP
jgi:putative ABC transport system permease protein